METTTNRGRPLGPPRTEFETTVRDLMARQGVQSYAALARVVGVSPGTLQRVMAGTAMIETRPLVRMARVLGCSIDSLVKTMPADLLAQP